MIKSCSVCTSWDIQPYFHHEMKKKVMGYWSVPLDIQVSFFPHRYVLVQTCSRLSPEIHPSAKKAFRITYLKLAYMDGTILVLIACHYHLVLLLL